ncbi:monovalent cation/H+ antiporter subunit A [Devosia ginsengisoli]|uniref:Monovalent cation/H+ antiporter subunit A n=2 Tax=Devosia ginsengisoli TaxID=400770 RepID=A0A5B8LY65_9HYPH|nr:monovalent cation/H+ antiporter subunit A [Devosia ginsengisoli]QDZ13267.1 monovalent cation/H+ antiporter subunit A [Devosia ginsengisoli]
MLIALIGLPFLGSVIAALLPSGARTGAAILAGLVALVCLALTIFSYTGIAGGEVVRHDIAWLPDLGLNVVLRLNGFSWLFAIMITGIGFLVVLYARYYMSPKDPVPRFFSFLLAFMGAMLGIVLSGNLIQLVMFWELTGIFSFLLIGYWHHNAGARDGARMALIVTGTGGLALLVAMLLMGHIVGSYDLDVVLASGDTIRNHPYYIPTLLLVLLAAFTKSAQFPFQFWLPRAMAAPTPVSAYLHSATMVKAGVFLLVLFWPVMAGTQAWQWIVTYTGLATLLIGAYSAIFQQDLKGVLAYSTISHLGLITALIGMSSPLALVAAIFHIANHATFKASLFMAAGIIDHETGTRDIRRLSGLFRFMPFTATLAMVAAAAMAGVPLLNGFLSKEMFFAETAIKNTNPFVDVSLPFAAVLGSLFAVTYSLRFIHGVFFGPPPTELDRVPHEPPALMRRPIEILVLICLLVGIIPGIAIGPYLGAAVLSVLGPEAPYYSLAIWHGFTTPLLMSLVALVGGVLLYFLLQKYLARGIDGAPLIDDLIGPRTFERLLILLSVRWAKTLERVFGTRRLQPQLAILVGIAVLAGAAPFLGASGRLSLSLEGADLALAFVWVIGTTCAVGAAVQAKYHRLAALMLMGGAGLATCITFVWFSAPDLALTQLLVEVVTTVLILLGLRWLPKRWQDANIDVAKSRGARFRRARDMVLAIASGTGLAFMAYAVMTRDAPRSIASFFVENAYALGGGHNVVNVILVDFRGFDTLGEITVLGIVALTTFALLRRFRPAADSIERPEQQVIQSGFEGQRSADAEGTILSDFLFVPSVIMRWLFPVIIVLAIYLFLRGHDQPGGGFIAGITMSIAFVLQYLAGGTRWVEDRLRILPTYWIGAGLLLALLTGIGSWLFGYPFLTTSFRYLDLPLFGKIPMATALLFDLGVFILVVGATVLILVAIAHQSIRGAKPARLRPARVDTPPAGNAEAE